MLETYSHVQGSQASVQKQLVEYNAHILGLLEVSSEYNYADSPPILRRLRTISSESDTHAQYVMTAIYHCSYSVFNC